jgi:hypothetical protein
MSGVTPRITAQNLETFQDRVVRIVGKVTQIRGTQVTIDSNGPVVLRFASVRPSQTCILPTASLTWSARSRARR